MPTIAIIIPCYNEELRLSKNNIQDLINGNKNIKIYFANDGSTDNTKNLIDEICAEIPNCYAIHFMQNEGKSKTIYKAVHQLNAQNQFDYIGYFDADFSTPSNELLKLIHQLEIHQPNFIFASRIKTLNATINRKVHRHFIGRAILTIINIKHHLGIYDTQCGCKIFSKQMINEAFKDKFFTTWLFDVEVFVRLKNKNLLNQGTEFPIKEWYDVEGSKLKFTHFFKIFKEIIILYTKYK
ncbi:glycosyltransferase [Faecalibacter bovis]|uniref:Glycosyltransferase n=1 Tax=Faecalibacter bovis TaxID=2898187 RepID=A0ABX7XFF0_9FLAO|nr:glycosyltransferase [Faecalibacter bovis]MBS7332677.1 glycosyltransferase [Weeksellaceae bacterium]QTV06687.1 glycosyltransferase [Faecalibacter bovis]